MTAENLNLRDIHLPEPISWWPIAPGWWLIIAAVFFIAIIIYLFLASKRKRKLKQQLPDDIKTELQNIKQQFQNTRNKVQLAKALSILLRRASISYYPEKDIAGLIGESWLAYLDQTHTLVSTKTLFNSDLGKALLSAPYLPDTAEPTFDAQALLTLCESWLCSPHEPGTFVDAISAPGRENIADTISDNRPDTIIDDNPDSSLDRNPDSTTGIGVTVSSGKNITPTSPLSRVTP